MGFGDIVQIILGTNRTQKTKKKRKYLFFGRDLTEAFKKIEKFDLPGKGPSFDEMLGHLEISLKQGKGDGALFGFCSDTIHKMLAASRENEMEYLTAEGLKAALLECRSILEKVEKIAVEEGKANPGIVKQTFDHPNVKKNIENALKERPSRKKSLKKSGGEKTDGKGKDSSDKSDKKEGNRDGTPVLQKAVFIPKTRMEMLLLTVAEKKFGKMNAANAKDILAFIKNFDFNAPNAEKVLREALRDTLPMAQATVPYPYLSYYYFDMGVGIYDFYRRYRWGNLFGDDEPRPSPFNEQIFWLFYDHVMEEKGLIAVYVPTENKDPLAEAMKKFNERNGFSLNTEVLDAIFHEINQVDEGKDLLYRKAYVETFVHCFNHARDKYENITDLLCDYDSVMTEMAKKNSPTLEVGAMKFGGLTSQQAGELLHSLVEEHCNLSKQHKQELINEKDGKAVSVLEAIRVSQEKITESGKMEDPEAAMAEMVSRLGALQQIHAGRGKGFAVLHPILYRNEAKAIESLKKDILEKMPKAEALIAESEQGKTIYTPGFGRVSTNIEKFIENMEREPFPEEESKRLNKDCGGIRMSITEKDLENNILYSKEREPVVENEYPLEEELIAKPDSLEDSARLSENNYPSEEEVNLEANLLRDSVQSSAPVANIDENRVSSLSSAPAPDLSK